MMRCWYVIWFSNVGNYDRVLYEQRQYRLDGGRSQGISREQRYMLFQHHSCFNLCLLNAGFLELVECIEYCGPVVIGQIIVRATLP